MYLTNEGMFSAWYQLNQANEDENQWMVYMDLLLDIVQGSLGKNLINQICFEKIWKTDFSIDYTRINKVFLTENPISDEMANVMFIDSYYGLKYWKNYEKWN